MVSSASQNEIFFKRYLGQKVKVIIDRPLGSKHPDFDMIYPVNYGFLPDTKAPDGDEIDAYILGINEPIKEFEGIIIAVIHRLDDNEDKLVLAEKGKDFNDKEIKNLTNFQEKYFKSKLIR